MAKATKVSSDYTINLELNRKEAEVLTSNLGQTLFLLSSHTPHYEALNNIYKSLTLAGVRYPDNAPSMF